MSWIMAVSLQCDGAKTTPGLKLNPETVENVGERNTRNMGRKTKLATLPHDRLCITLCCCHRVA